VQFLRHSVVCMCNTIQSSCDETWTRCLRLGDEIQSSVMDYDIRCLVNQTPFHIPTYKAMPTVTYNNYWQIFSQLIKKMNDSILTKFPAWTLEAVPRALHFNKQAQRHVNLIHLTFLLLIIKIHTVKKFQLFKWEYVYAEDTYMLRHNNTSATQL